MCGRNWIGPRQCAEGNDEVHDEKLSSTCQLGRVAAWHRGVDLGSDGAFSSDGAELLHQTRSTFHFSDKAPSHVEFNLPIIRQIQDALVEVKPLIDVGESAHSADSVKKVNEITTRSARVS